MEWESMLCTITWFKWFRRILWIIQLRGK
jgi:hypothetical protein